MLTGFFFLALTAIRSKIIGCPKLTPASRISDVMKNRTTASPPPALPAFRYHLQGNDGLFRPIPFLFVTDRMHQEISAERQKILEITATERRERQIKLLERYDPNRSSTAFNDMLNLFNPGSK